MKALFFTREFPPYVYGGAGVHVEYLAEELTKLINVDVRRLQEPLIERICSGDLKNSLIGRFCSRDSRVPHVAVDKGLGLGLGLTKKKKKK